MSKESNACKIIILWASYFNRQFKNRNTYFDTEIIESFQRYILAYDKLTFRQKRALRNIWNKFEIGRWAQIRGMSL